MAVKLFDDPAQPLGVAGVIAAMAHKKLTLPTKTCVACQRPFAWRKKWARDWDAVKYCSERCRRTGAGEAGQG